jgi:hypothetical protein
VESHLRIATGNGADLRFYESVTSWSLLPGVGHTGSSKDELKWVKETSRDFEANITKKDEGNPQNTDGDLYKVCTKSTDGAVLSESIYFTRKIVIAAGAWAPALYGSEIPISLHAERRVQYWFKPKSNEELFKVLLCTTFDFTVTLYVTLVYDRNQNKNNLIEHLIISCCSRLYLSISGMPKKTECSTDSPAKTIYQEV